MEAMTDTRILCRLGDGMVVTLTASDCAELLNAMARSRMLEVLVVALPEKQYETIATEECCAWATVEDDEYPDEDARVYLEVNAGLFSSATPRETAKKARKKA